jgi:hypothetical protein
MSIEAGDMTLLENSERAVREAQLAYEFNANSYTAGALSAALAVKAAVDLIVHMLIPAEADGGGREAGDGAQPERVRCD